MITYLDENLYEADEHQLFDSDKLVSETLYYDRIDLISERIDIANHGFKS